MSEPASVSANDAEGVSANGVELRLPATSANLGPGFDAVGLAMNFHLHVRAAVSTAPTLNVTGRDAAKIGNPDDNLMLATFREVLQAEGVAVPLLDLHVHNEIPLGMGCGSSAAALVAGVALANRFGPLGWDRERILTEASRREGHPDNVAACVLGGFTVSAMREEGVEALALQPAAPWQLLLVLPDTGLPTRTARALLPMSYSREDAVTNVQNVALLTAAFASGDGALLRNAMRDRMHQPYREEVCPLLPRLLPLSGFGDVLGVALSGAGPSVLLVVRSAAEREHVERAVQNVLTSTESNVQLLWTQIAESAFLG